MAVAAYAAMYFIIGALPAVIDKLADRGIELDGRNITVMCLLALLNGTTNLKAYVSQTFANWAGERSLISFLPKSVTSLLLPDKTNEPNEPNVQPNPQPD